MSVDTSSQDSRRFVRGLHNLKPDQRGSVVTIGSFDGVHLGHQAILRQVREQANLLSLSSVAMIFEPQPHEFFAGERAPARLMRLRDKVLALLAEGINRVLCLPFNRSLSRLTADDFIHRILLRGLGTRYLVVGDDFRFGIDRTGNYDRLQSAGLDHGFQVTDTPTFQVNGERVSSTRIRELLQQNAFTEAASLLGRPYTIGGRVVKGKQLGRQLGAPTANVHLHRYRSPLSGVFAVTVRLQNRELVAGVANVGVRPTLGGDDKPLLEVHLFDRDMDLYNQTIVVEFIHKLREEKRFDSMEELGRNIQQDIQQAKDFLLTSVKFGGSNSKAG